MTEYKGRTLIVPAEGPLGRTVLRADLTFGLSPASFFRNGLFSIEGWRTPKEMLCQQIVRRVTGAGEPSCGNFDVQVSIGQLFDAKAARQTLRQIIEEIVGLEVWCSFGYRDDELSVYFTDELSTGGNMQPHIQAGKKSNPKVPLTPLGQQVVASIREVTDKSLSVGSSSISFKLPEPELLGTIEQVESCVFPHLGSSGHTIKWA